MRSSRVLVAAVVLAAAGCAPRAFVRPVGPAAPAPDAASIWLDASAACRATTAVRAALGLTGQIRDQRIPGLAGATLYAAVSANGDIGLEARVSGQLVFRLGGTAGRATLLLPADNRVVIAKAEDIVDALIGVRLGPERLLATLAGCLTRADTVRRASRFGSVLEIETGDATVYLEERAGVWMSRAGIADGLAIEYRRDGTQLRDITFRSEPARQARVSIAMRVKELDRTPVLTPALFTVIVPEDARPMSVDELRTSGLIDDGGPAR